MAAVARRALSVRRRRAARRPVRCAQEKTATTLERALSSDEGVRTARAAKDYEYAAQRTAERWAAGVVADIKKMRR